MTTVSPVRLPTRPLVVGSDDPGVLDTCRAEVARVGLGPPLAWVSAGDSAQLTALTLFAAFAALPPDEAGSAAVYLAADEHCVQAATVFAQRAADSGRRLRPSDSMRLETSELVRTVGGWPGRTGPCYVLTSPGSATAQGQALAWAAVRSGARPAAVVCEVLRAGPDGPGLVTALILRTGDARAVPLADSDLGLGDPWAEPTRAAMSGRAVSAGSAGSARAAGLPGSAGSAGTARTAGATGPAGTPADEADASRGSLVARSALLAAVREGAQV
ncbi:hypothetical protein GCM10023080_070300 [Streptomyces pseudoechinosporeus]